jgi:tyrosyl-tRNA synthetase
MKLSEELIERGFIHQIAGPDLATIVDGEKRVVYQGIDPSADSAHAGNMVIWMLLRHLAADGHKIIFLVGGGTGMIGDPKPDAERELRAADEVAANVANLRAQAEQFFAGMEIEFVNNLDWLGELGLLEFLRDVGKHYTVNELIKKDAIATRLQSDTGLSYTEFAYPLLQGYDYYQLFKTKNTTLQIGGSDQWGNIVSGVELVRRKAGVQVYAATVPLIIDKATGKKFGKSEGNAVWLDPRKTSPYEFYQFWLNVSDESVVEYLKLFTLLPLSAIDELRKRFDTDPGGRAAQQVLAREVTALVHGVEQAETAAHVSELLFGSRTLADLTDEERAVLVTAVPSSTMRAGTSLVEALVETGLATSKREARTFLESGAVMLNGEKVTEIERSIEVADVVGGLIFLRRGKKLYHVIEVR